MDEALRTIRKVTRWGARVVAAAAAVGAIVESKPEICLSIK
jgi:hypothetical protein